MQVDDDHLPMWEEEANGAMEFCLSQMEIDLIQGTLSIPSRDDTSYGFLTSDSPEDLHSYLMEVYDEMWYANAPFDGGQAVFESDSWSVSVHGFALAS